MAAGDMWVREWHLLGDYHATGFWLDAREVASVKRTETRRVHEMPKETTEITMLDGRVILIQDKHHCHAGRITEAIRFREHGEQRAIREAAGE